METCVLEGPYIPKSIVLVCPSPGKWLSFNHYNQIQPKLKPDLTKEIWVRMCANSGAKVYLESQPGSSPLLSAIENDQQLAVEALLQSADKSDHEATTGHTAIMQAVQFERWVILTTLVTCFESLDFETTIGETAMLAAVRRGQVDGIQVRSQSMHMCEWKIVRVTTGVALACA